jgi:hypothetical protein
LSIDRYVQRVSFARAVETLTAGPPRRGPRCDITSALVAATDRLDPVDPSDTGRQLLANAQSTPRGRPMRLLVVFLISLVVSQSISIGVGLLVERNTTPYTGLVTFIALYFAMFWVAWRFAIRITEPNALLGSRLSSAEK